MTRIRVAAGALGLIFAIILIAPAAEIVNTLVALAALIGVAASIVFAVTFWRSARVWIGRRKLRYRAVRRRAGAIALLGLGFLIEQRISLVAWHINPTPQASTTRFAADRLKILADLKAGKFDVLDQELRSYQVRAEQNIAMEANTVFAFDTFSNTEPALRPLLDEWEKQLPDSFVPHLAKAEYLFALGSKARGAKWANETSDRQFARMNDYYTQEVAELKQVISRNKKVADSYVLLIEAARASEGPEFIRKIATEGLKEIPSSFAIRRAYMTTLEPRWGGSYEAMDQFSRDSEAMIKENPEIAVLKGFPDYYRANVLTWKDDYAGALPLYARAIAEGGELDSFYRDRGRAFQSLGRAADALADLERSDQLGPQNAQTLVAIAYALVYLGRTKEARDKLDIAAQLAEPDEDARKLRDQLAHDAD